MFQAVATEEDEWHKHRRRVTAKGPQRLVSMTAGLNHRSRSDSAISWAHIFLAVHTERIAFLILCLSVSAIQQFDYSQALARDLAQDCVEFGHRTDNNLDMESI